MNRSSAAAALVFALVAGLTVKLDYDPKKGYAYHVSGGSAEEVIDADMKMKEYLKKGKVPGRPVTPPPAATPANPARH